MNLHPIITPNAKGQLVIPAAIRKSLHLTPTTPLEVQAVGNHIVLKPVKAVITSDSTQDHYLEALKRTAGAWADDNWPETQKAQRDIEITAANQRRQTW